jgi:outer membrane murein-binding lipoprotein Lpp
MVNTIHTDRQREKKRQQEPQVGDTSNIDDVDDSTFAEKMGFDLQDDDGRDDLQDVDDFENLVGVVGELVDEVNDLREENDELRDTVESQQQTIQDLTAKVNELSSDTKDTREIARSAVATANQVEATVQEELSEEDTSEVNRRLPGDVEPSTSPLDFFANCRAESVREMYVIESNRINSYRAVQVAKRWDEFAIVDEDSGEVAWKRSTVEKALTAEMGEQPHPQTINRVWEKFAELGSDDVQETQRKIGRSQDKYDVLRMDLETAKGLQEGRYLHLDLLEGSGPTSGGLTPVVTGGDSAEV